MMSFLWSPKAMVKGAFASLTLAAYVLQTVGAIDVDSTILILTPGAGREASLVLKGYGIPYQVVTIPSTGITLPTLNSTTALGNYGGIVIINDAPGIKSNQLADIYSYQSYFGVRLVRLNAGVSSEYGVKLAANGGCCTDGVDQVISISDSSQFRTAGIRERVDLPTKGLWHIPTVISDPSIAKEFVQFGTGGAFTTNTTAGVINQLGNRQQMIFFIGFGTEWSLTSTVLSHVWINWITRGLYTGFKRVYLNTQVDDVFLPAVIFDTNKIFRARDGDLNAHKTWMTFVNGKMNAGSNYFMELAHNGNGNIANSSDANACKPTKIAYTSAVPRTDLEFQKPLGTGADVWPQGVTQYPWTETCVSADPLEVWFENDDNLNSFAHVSHTFTHLYLNNATYADTVKEITFNNQWMRQVGITSAKHYSGDVLVPPAITGMHNGDAIRAWMDNGIWAVVGDNTRSVLMNQESEHWALTSTVAANGYDGLTIIPRWSTIIYFDCDNPRCIEVQYESLYSNPRSFSSLLAESKDVSTRSLLALRHDPFMFHQANLRQIDAVTTAVGGVTGKRSLLQIWVETVVYELARLTTFPIVTLPFSALAKSFVDRQTRDTVCKPRLIYTLSPDQNTITYATISAAAACNVAIPLTVPGDVSQTGFAVDKEKLGSDPLTVWASTLGQDRKFQLVPPVNV